MPAGSAILIISREHLAPPLEIIAHRLGFAPQMFSVLEVLHYPIESHTQFFFGNFGHDRRISSKKTLFKITKAQSAFTCSKLTIETLEQGVKYVQS